MLACVLQATAAFPGRLILLFTWVVSLLCLWPFQLGWSHRAESAVSQKLEASEKDMVPDVGIIADMHDPLLMRAKWELK